MIALDRQDRIRLIRKRIGLGFAALPLLVVGAFAFGEGLGGEAGWWGHLIQLGIGVALIVAGWRLPQIGGPLLIVAGIALAIRFGIAAALLLGLPLIVSGAFFTLAGRADREAHERRHRIGGTPT